MNDKNEIIEEAPQEAVVVESKKNMKTRQTFNAKTQQSEDAVVTVDLNGEYVFTFADGSFLKFPGDLDRESINAALVAHQLENEGQLSTSAIEKANEEKLKNI